MSNGFKITNTAGETYHVDARTVKFDNPNYVRFYDYNGRFLQAFLAQSVLIVENLKD
jgi:hypothetical protein